MPCLQWSPRNQPNLLEAAFKDTVYIFKFIIQSVFNYNLITIMTIICRSELGIYHAAPGDRGSSCDVDHVPVCTFCSRTLLTFSHNDSASAKLEDTVPRASATYAGPCGDGQAFR